MDPDKDKLPATLDDFKKVSAFMRDTLKEVDALIGPQQTYEICAHCLDPMVCITAWRLRLCVDCRENTARGWLVVE